MSGAGAGQSVWLFTSETHSVRLLIQQTAGHLMLVVWGPGTESAQFEFGDMDHLERFRQTFERDLITRGFQVQAVAERRRAPDRATDTPPATPERRRRD